MPIPHATWAHCYDFAYENSHGQLYHSLTELTVEAVRGLMDPPCSVVDFGAGTGRLAVPLAARGYAVTAVEPCQEMMAILQAKARDANVVIQSRVERMQDFDGPGGFDIALCVFTTLLYLLDEPSLREGLTRFMYSLRSGGRLLIDIPGRHAFQSYRRQTPILDRNVTVTPVGGDIYTYREQIRCCMDGNWQQFEDTFQIRYWPAKKVLTMLQESGAVCEGPIPGFEWTGADYYSGTKSI